MAVDWSPTSGIEGLDFAVTDEGGTRLDGSSRVAAAIFTSTAAETVTAYRLYLRNVVGSALYRASVYATSSLPETVTTSTFRPNAVTDATNVGVTGAATQWEAIDEATLDTADYMSFNAASARIDVQFNTASGLSAGAETIVAVRVKAWVESTSGAASINSLFLPTTNTSQSTEGSQTVQAVDGATLLTWTYNLTANDVPMDDAEVQQLDTTTRELRVSSTTGNIRVYQMWLEVDWLADPLSHAEASVSTDGWTTFTPSPSWSKADATEYMVALRKKSGSGGATWPTVDSGSALSGGTKSMRPLHTPSRGIYELSDELTAVHPFTMTVAGVASVDSQPYAAILAADVDADNTPSQEITRPSTATVGWVRLVARSQRVSQVPDAPLLVKVKNSGGTQQGGTATFGTHLLADAPYQWHVLDETMASTVSLTNATQYDMEASCTAAAGAGWELVVLDAKGAGENRGFGGTTDVADIGGENDDYDIAIVQGTVPTAPADFTATANTAGEGSIDLAWTATSLAGSFSRYEIERLDPDGATWYPIAYETTEATVAYVDETARRGTAETYRIRVKHSNGTRSLPSASDDATLTKSGTYLIFPESPTLSRSVNLHHDGIGFAYPRDRSETDRYGARFPTVTEYPTDRGIVITGTVNLQGGTDGLASQAAWTRTVKDDTTYAVLVNGYGERWIVSVAFEDGTFEMPGLQRIGFRAREITDTPIVVES